MNEWKAGHNCWQHPRASTLGLLVDADEYYRALADALESARRTAFIIGWDIDSRVRLRREQDETLVELLERATERNPDLSVYVLTWDFSILFAMERESFTRARLGWGTCDRIRFRMDGRHPPGASHHGKVAVIDDRLAFCGGIDLTSHRWDTSNHDPDDPNRVTPAGNPYSPFHDVQGFMTGPAARAVGEYARSRWLHATGEWIPGVPQDVAAVPPSPPASLSNVRVGLCRTWPGRNGSPGLTEVRTHLLESIEHARRLIYIEGQYLTSEDIASALEDKLRERDGPDVVMFTPEQSSGWVQQTTMDTIRAHVVRRLRNVGKDRFQIRVPHVGDSPVTVHAKVLIIDDRIAHIGSANLSNRSLGLDSELDWALHATTDDQRAVIGGWRNRLFAEHLGCDPAQLESALERKRAAQLLESLPTGPRSVPELDISSHPILDDLASTALDEPTAMLARWTRLA